MQIGRNIVLTMALTALRGPNTVAFLKRAGVLRQPTRRLFLQLFTLSAVLFGASFYLFRCLAAMDAAADLEPHYYYISPQNLVDIARVLKLAKNLLQGDHHRWWFRLAYLLSGVALGCLTYIATVFAAVASHSGEHHSLSSFLRKVKSNLLRPALTLAAVCAVRAAVVEAVDVRLPTMTGHWYVLRGVTILVLPFFAVIQAVGAVAVVASVAEPGLCCKGAVARACRLLLGKYTQAFHSMVASAMLDRPFWLLYTLVAMAGLPASGTVKCLLRIVEEMIAVARVTDYYFECRKREEHQGKAGHRD
ncbi:hypothetical protein ACQ4PT_000320 [Festuca glaucescens]